MKHRTASLHAFLLYLIFCTCLLRALPHLVTRKHGTVVYFWTFKEAEKEIWISSLCGSHCTLWGDDFLRFLHRFWTTLTPFRTELTYVTPGSKVQLVEPCFPFFPLSNCRGRKIRHNEANEGRTVQILCTRARNDIASKASRQCLKYILPGSCASEKNSSVTKSHPTRQSPPASLKPQRMRLNSFLNTCSQADLSSWSCDFRILFSVDWLFSLYMNQMIFYRVPAAVIF